MKKTKIHPEFFSGLGKIVNIVENNIKDYELAILDHKVLREVRSLITSDQEYLDNGLESFCYENNIGLVPVNEKSSVFNENVKNTYSEILSNIFYHAAHKGMSKEKMTDKDVSTEANMFYALFANNIMEIYFKNLKGILTKVDGKYDSKLESKLTKVIKTDIVKWFTLGIKMKTKVDYFNEHYGKDNAYTMIIKYQKRATKPNYYDIKINEFVKK